MSRELDHAGAVAGEAPLDVERLRERGRTGCDPVVAGRDRGVRGRGDSRGAEHRRREDRDPSRGAG